MLFINFLCLLYLMVLIDSHTISKSIDNDEKVNDNIFDSINEVDPPTHPKTRRDKFLHRYKLYYNKDDDVTLSDGFKETKPFTELDRPADRINTKPSPKTTTEHKHHKSPKRRVGSFWRRLRGKDKKKEYRHDDNERKKRIPHHNREPQNRDDLTANDSRNPGLRANEKRKNRRKVNLGQPEARVTKRDVIGQYILQTKSLPVTVQKSISQTIITTTITNMIKLKPKELLPPELLEKSSEIPDSLSEDLDAITYNITNLKARYGLVKHASSNMESLPSAYAESENTNFSNNPITIISTTTTPAFQGTAHIEDMLSIIKSKASRMVSFQRPLVTNMIGSAVTFASFDPYPDVRRVSVPSSTGDNVVFTGISLTEPPYYNLTTFASTKGDLNGKTIVTSTGSDEFNLNDSIFSTNTESHNLAARSIKEDTMTIAQNVEDLLQRELKNIYNKVKHKVSSDFRKEIHEAKSTVREGYNKLSSKKESSKHTQTTCPPRAKTCPCKTAVPKKMNKPATTSPRVKKKDDQEDGRFIEDTPETPYAKRTYDDYMMLTLYEQMLARTHEDIVRKMLATTEFPIFPKNKRETFRLSKRNPETLTNVKLKETVQDIYDDGGNMPDYDYIDPLANVSSTLKTLANDNNNYNERNYNDIDYIIDPPTTEKPKAKIPSAEDPLGYISKSKMSEMQPMDDSTGSILNNYTDYSDSAKGTSLEGLSNKISYNEFVNGYRHYLKFQKDQNKQNFSNLVKYQAHRHHSVDDIGKYILNKIPPLPSFDGKEREKRFSDDSENNNMDYQEITTKSDDSWFRKHFYLFLDSGPPKKFHSSQTVELKSPIEQKLFVTEPTPKHPPKKLFVNIGSDNVARKAKGSPEVCLDDLTKMLDSIKDKRASVSEDEVNAQTDSFLSFSNVGTDANVQSKSFIGKLFSGKRRRDNKKETLSTWYFPGTGYMDAERAPERIKRSITKEELKNTVIDDFINKDLEEKITTFSPNHLKEVFADAAQGSSRETNKYGYVDIDLVPRQTAVVKLRENAKKSRIKNFFKKFHFKKNKKKTPKPKRSCDYSNDILQNNRKARFNPIKKLKSILFSKEEEKEKEEGATSVTFTMPEYEMNHAGSFKHLKFNKLMSLDEMKKQIPNISDIYFEADASTTQTSRLSSDVFKLDKSDRDLLYNYRNIKTAVAIKSTAKTGKHKTTTKFTSSTFPDTPLSTNLMIIPKKTSLKTRKCNVLTVNVKTVEPVTTTQTSVITFDDVSIGIPNLHNPLKKPTDGISTTSVTFSTYSPSISQRTAKFKKQIKPTVPPQMTSEGLVIKSKLTRFAKFPIRKRHFKIRSNDHSEPVRHPGFGRESILELLLDLKTTNAPSNTELDKGQQGTIHNPTNTLKHSNMERSKYTDYFNDLVMWHKDILNLDKVTNPFWQEIVKSIEQAQGETLTTPNMTQLKIELDEMKDHLDEIASFHNGTMTTLHVIPSKVRSKDQAGMYDNKINNRQEIRSVAMDDSAVVNSDDMIIKGEAKYFQYNQPKPRFHQLKSSDFITKLDNLNLFRGLHKVKDVQFKKKGRRYSLRPFDNYSEPAILLDTTLMAYDDEVDTVTKSLNDREMSMLLHKIRKNAPSTKNTMDHLIYLKTNKAPIQHYTTPLPMASHDFNKFLKDNSMDVEYLTSPTMELPTIQDNWPKRKTTLKKIHVKTTTTTLATTSTTKTTVKPTLIQTTTKPSTKKLKQNSISKQLSKFTKALSTHSGRIFKPKINAPETNFDNDFDRYKRYTEISKPPRTVNDKRNTPPQEGNYYSIFKKKMKEKLFEKKETAPVERSSLDPTDPLDKEVEITIINFDDIEKMTTQQPYGTYYFPAARRGEFSSFTEFPEMTSTEVLHKFMDSIPKEEIHNELLYKDVLKERTTSTTIANDYATVDLTQSTEYVDPMVNDAPTSVAQNKVKFPFNKIPIYPNIFNKMQHSDTPKRVHISSHHYKYDIFYDDHQKTKPKKLKVVEGYGLPPAASSPIRNSTTLEARITSGPITHRVIPTIFRKGTKADASKKTHKHSHLTRRKRKAWRPDVTHKKRKHFTFRGCKPKPNGGLTDPGRDLESLTLTSPLDSTTEVPEIWNEDPVLPRMENTSVVPETPKDPISAVPDESESRNKKPVTDGENMVTTYDKKGMESSTEDAETMSSLQSQFFTRISIKNKVSSKRASSTTASIDQAGSLIYDLEELEPTKPSKREENTSPKKEEKVKEGDRSGTLSKISSNKVTTGHAAKENEPNAKLAKEKDTAKLATKERQGPRKITTEEFAEENLPLYPGRTEAVPKPKTTKKKAVDEKEDDKGEGFRFSYRPNAANESVDYKKHLPSPHKISPTHMTPKAEEDTAAKQFYQSTFHQEHYKTSKCTMIHESGNEVIFIEPSSSYNEQLYSSAKILPTTTTSTTEDYQLELEHSDVKREARQLNTFTAKDVAALEVVVDLMKNTLSYEDNSVANVHNNTNSNIVVPFPAKSLHSNGSTNSIQVHIAIPFDFQKGKRSAAGVLNPVRVRKVFSAKMSSPVDLEYQVHSFEGTIQTTSTKKPTTLNNFTMSATDKGGLTPGMYLLIDKPKNGFALKPVIGPISLSDLNTRQVSAGTTASMSSSKLMQTRIETTSLKSMAKVTLSKDFISAVNEKLIEMYENLSRTHDVKVNQRPARSVWPYMLSRDGAKRSAENYITKRRIDWETVKKYFGHDRVCNCKCQCNKTMCRACAASDAVIDELIFEFDNLGRYMSDHCTEIQTFFWMNPTAGQKLRDSVNKIDRSLTDYYKRVKGKCQGRLCENFGTCIDKRQFTKNTKIKKEDAMDHLINDLTVLAEDLNKTVALEGCYNNRFKEKGEEFLNTLNRCILRKTFDKRSNPHTTPKKMIKNVYSLDNINVNIICNPETEAKTDLQALSATISSLKGNSPELYDHLVDYELQKIKHTKRKGLKKLFPRKSKKSKLLNYFDFGKSTKSTFKRQVNNQVETPLISDVGGGFWYDYLKAGVTSDSRLVRDSIKRKPNIEIEVVQRQQDETTNIVNLTKPPKADAAANMMNITVQMTSAMKKDDIESTTENLSYSINRLLWLLGNLPDVEAMNKNSNRSMMFLSNLTKGIAAESDKLADDKIDDAKSIIDQVKQKIYNTGPNKKTTKPIKSITPKTSTASTPLTSLYIKAGLDKKLNEITTLEQSLDLVPTISPPKFKFDTPLENVTSRDEGNVMVVTTNNIPNEVAYKSSTKLIIPIPKHTTKKVAPSKATTKPVSASKAITETTSSKITPLTSSDSAEKTTTASAHPTIVSIIDDVSLSTPIFDNSSAITTSFYKKLKTATMKLFKKVSRNSQTYRHTTIPTTRPLESSSIINIIESNDRAKENDYAIEPSSQTASPNPTIVILNEYDNQPEKEAMPDFNREGYKSLLLSIIQFETNNLNDEWDTVAYGGAKHKIETDMRRSVMNYSDTDPAKPTKPLMPDVMEGDDEAPEQKLSTKKPEGLLNKIVSKMGIKIVPTKKKVANKQNIRDVNKEEKIIKHGKKLRINNFRINNLKQQTRTKTRTKTTASTTTTITTTTSTTTPTTTLLTTEACDSRPKTKPQQMCDIQATYDHIKTLQTSLPPKAFEKLVKNISCYKYKDLDSAFFIIPYTRQGKRWNWIRSKRSLKRHFYRNEPEFDVETSFNDVSMDSFERFVKGDDGIYKIINRRKRTANIVALDRGLRNIPTLIPGENELYVLLGDSVKLDCGSSTPVRTCDGQFLWKTDRKGILKHDNVDVNGISITIHNLEPRNVGRYTCSLDHTVRKNIKLSVLTIPSFDIVFQPMYKTGKNCSYDDLKAIQRLPSLMANETNCGETCSIRIDEPVCLRDKVNSSLIRATVIITMGASGVNCSLQCKRDIVASLVMLCAANTAFLSSIGVLVSRDGFNQTLTPWKDVARPVVTHMLRKKDTNGHHEYHKLASLLSPGKVDVVVICPAGYYLLPSYKLCSSCPPDTSSKIGDNTCRVCPSGTRADPGAASCYPDTRHPRRYDWWWYPPGGYLVACCGVVFGCTSCVLLSVIVHIVSRDSEHRKDDNCDDYEQKRPKTVTSMTVAYAHIPHTRPLSPSRVILPRFFRPSLTSSRATDSQETKFELWKEKNIPPPLPPIDFDP